MVYSKRQNAVETSTFGSEFVYPIRVCMHVVPKTRNSKHDVLEYASMLTNHEVCCIHILRVHTCDLAHCTVPSGTCTVICTPGYDGWIVRGRVCPIVEPDKFSKKVDTEAYAYK